MTLNIDKKMPIIEGWEQRIEAVLGEDCERNAANCQRWGEHLLKSLVSPVWVTGIEDFLWEEGEEPYAIGGWDPDEYKDLKETNPSYSDEFELYEIGTPGEHADLMVSVRRVEDKEEFEIALSWLETIQEDCAEYQLLSDYSVWHCNY